jgi:hypothetical protein
MPVNNVNSILINNAAPRRSRRKPQPEQQDGVVTPAAVNNVNSILIQNAGAIPLPNPLSGRLVCPRTHSSLAVGGRYGSTYRFIRMRSSSRISSLTIVNSAMGGFTAANVGLYQINGGPAVNATAFATGLSLAAANTGVGTPVVFPLIQFGLRIWEMLGLPADPAVEYDVVVTSTAQTGTAGFIGLKMTWCDN